MEVDLLSLFSRMVLLRLMHQMLAMYEEENKAVVRETKTATQDDILNRSVAKYDALTKSNTEKSSMRLFRRILNCYKTVQRFSYMLPEKTKRFSLERLGSYLI